MRAIILGEFLVYGLGLLFIITQVIIPGFTNRPLFPILRSKRRELEGALAQNLEEQDIQELEKQVQSTTPKRRRRGEI